MLRKAGRLNDIQYIRSEGENSSKIGKKVMKWVDLM